MPLLKASSEINSGYQGQRPMGERSDSLALRAPFASGRSTPADGARHGLLAVCANPACRSGWLRLWRSRQGPIFEEGWTCSFECTAARVRSAILRELVDRKETHEPHRHRVPLGLLMMQRGWISREQLHRALDAQRVAGAGRLGYWLMRQSAASEETITRALGLQWSCPVLDAERHACIRLSPWIPRLILDAFRVLPVRLAATRILYLGFVERLDPVLALAVERMTGLRVECCVVAESQFLVAHANTLKGRFPATELVEAVSPSAAAHALAKSIEAFRPAAARLVRVHDCLWLRMWPRSRLASLPETDGVQDVLCSIMPGLDPSSHLP
jgi:Type II secretion system (T2SS), protein E, N-terminal domain